MSLKPKVLVVEHDPEVLKLLKETLTQMEAEFECLESGQQAAELINREKFDGVFLDLGLPDMSGCELAEKIRWSKSNSRCPLVMIMDSPTPEMLKRCYRTGVNFFLEKPLTSQEIETLLNATRGMMARERRRYQRAPVKVRVHCQWEIQSLPQVATGESIDLSTSGMQMHLGLTPPPGGVMQVRFTLPGHSCPYEFTARTVRIGSNQKVGITFVGLTQEKQHQLMEFTDRVLAGSAKAHPSSGLY